MHKPNVSEIEIAPEHARNNFPRIARQGIVTPMLIVRNQNPKETRWRNVPDAQEWEVW